MALKPILPNLAGLVDLPPRFQPLAMPRRTRASKPKVRTGCATCKTRRVKCDEAKPTCQRCQKAGIACDGYDKPLAAGPPAPRKHANPLALPRKTAAGLAFSRPALRPNPAAVSFTRSDVPYFDLFCHQLSDDLSGYFFSDFWSRIVLCESITNDCVRQAVLAIGALSQAVSQVSRPSGPSRPGTVGAKPTAFAPWSAENVANDQHRTALRYYVKALARFRERIDGEISIASPRSTLIMTLLLITFELLQCNMAAVDGLMTTGVALLKDSLELYRHATPQQDAATLPRPEDDMEDIENILPHLSVMGGYTPFLQAQKTNLALWESSAVSEVPDISCRKFNHIQSRWNKFFTRAAAFTAQSFMGHKQNLPSSSRKAALREQQAFLAQLERWRHLLDVSLARAMTSGDRRAKRSMQMMQLHFRMIRICLACCLDSTDMVWDDYDDEFLVLVERCLAFAAEAMPGYHAGYTLSMGGLSMLGPAISKCRNHDIRMRALEVVRRMPWREGTWDACAELTAQLGAVLLEERARDANGFVSAENRWTWIGGEWDLKRGVLYGQYLRSMPDDSGNLVVAPLEVDLDSWPDICAEVSCFKDHSIDCRVLDPREGNNSSF